ncbi:hypothetical protein TWF730_008086 [Orbilia blumenaviensis]|uniref:C2H2-type domain-containing protein n=1 Tax=Orbilia blumenaviensis TaxID=1796055 RepID=A0AAV9V9V4_9PEZI
MAAKLQVCDVCKEAVETQKHLAILHCCICDYEFVDTDLYNLHIMIIHLWKDGSRDAPSAEFSCVDCQEEYFDEKAFYNHLAEHDQGRKFAQEESQRLHSSSPSELEPPTKETSRSKRKRKIRNKSAAVAPTELQETATPLKKKKKKSKLKEELNSKEEHTPKKESKPKKEPKPKMVYICPDCGRDFTGKRGRRFHKCPNQYPCLSEACLRTFRKITGLVDHLESGACKGGYNRKNISRMLCERDTKSLITVTGALKLLEEHYRDLNEVTSDVDSDLEDSTGGVSLSSWGGLTPILDGSEASFEIIKNRVISPDNLDVLSMVSDCSGSNETPRSPAPCTEVSEPANPKQCQICFKVFQSTWALKAHVNSAAHAPKVYHCKLSFLGLKPKGAVKEFNTLSGLVAHIETGGCRGGKSTFDVVVSMLGRLAEELGFSATNETRQRLIAIASSKPAPVDI